MQDRIYARLPVSQFAGPGTRYIWHVNQIPETPLSSELVHGYLKDQRQQVVLFRPLHILLLSTPCTSSQLYTLCFLYSPSTFPNCDVNPS